MTEQMNGLGPRDWEIEAETRIVSDHTFVEKAPTGMAWGRCGCGSRIEGMNGAAIPAAEVEDRMRDHIREDHPGWPETMLP